MDKKKGRTSIFCNQCNKEFSKPNWRITKRNFCNRTCQHEFYRKEKGILKQCKICKECFLLAPSEYKKFTTCLKQECKTAIKTKENNPNWRGGYTKTRKIDMSRKPYKLWRKSVLERDNYKCVNCDSIENLEADHIKPWAYFPEERYNINNGSTLCRKCHQSRMKEVFKYRK